MDWDISYLDQVQSTQDLVRTHAENGGDEGYVLQAGQQIKGRGRRGNAWTSLPDNLQMSVLLRPDRRADATLQLSFVVAVAIAHAFGGEGEAAVDIGLKWPNDIFIGNQKCGGILIEAAAIENDRIPYVIIGIGLNIQNAPEGGAKLNGDVTPARDKVLNSLGQHYSIWKNDGFAPIRDVWLKKAIRINEAITVRGAKDTQDGIFRGIDESGALLLQTPEGIIKTISAGEVWF